MTVSITVDGRDYVAVPEEQGCDGCAFAPLSSGACDRAHDAALAAGGDGCGWSKIIYLEKQ